VNVSLNKQEGPLRGNRISTFNPSSYLTVVQDLLTSIYWYVGSTFFFSMWNFSDLMQVVNHMKYVNRKATLSVQEMEM